MTKTQFSNAAQRHCVDEYLHIYHRSEAYLILFHIGINHRLLFSSDNEVILK